MQPNVSRKWFVLASPVLIIIIGHFTARFFLSLFNDWAWLGTFLVYWGSMLLVIRLLGDKTAPKRWSGRSQGSRWWILPAVVIGSVSFPLLLIPNLQAMKPVGLVIAWFLFAVVNSICEEAFWRGFLLDGMDHLPRIFSVAYATILFTLIHPVMMGVFSKVQAFDPARPTALIPFWSILVVLSLVLAMLYLKTKSLRLPVLAHFLTDLGNLSIFLFMNLIAF